MQQPVPTQDIRNLIAALVLSTGILFAWQYFYEAPKERQAAAIAREAAMSATTAKPGDTAPISAPNTGVPALPNRPRAERVQASPRVAIRSETLHGSINRKGLRLDDLTLAGFRQSLDPASPEVVLLSPAGGEEVYFSEIGWVAATPGLKVPDQDTLWQASSDTLSPGTPVTFSWDNGAGLTFQVTFALDNHYLFTAQQNVTNRTGEAVSLHPYGLINRAFPNLPDQFLVQHDGPLGVLDGALDEVHYKTLKEEGPKQYANATGWLGITDKYWLTALVPGDGTGAFTAQFSHYESGGQQRYQADYRGSPVTVPAGGTAGATLRLFAGAKELKLLDSYATQYHIPLFDRAVDLGVLYFLTKPLFQLLSFFYGLVGNFGIAILLLTVVVKLALFPLAHKSFSAMGQMKRLTPQMTALRERHKDDKMRLNQEMMALYKREKVNPLSGCLPLLIQLPVFFALYKVLYVTIEMRHAPFFGWIHDLSAPDPTNFFTLFGLIAWNPPAFLHIGIWPVLMTATMVIQQKLNPPPADPTQAKVMQWLPFIFLFLFASFPAGLVIYWAWSNLLSILQQYTIQRMATKNAPQPA